MTFIQTKSVNLSQRLAKRMYGGCGLHLKRLNLKQQREYNKENLSLMSLFIPIVKVLGLWKI